MAIIKGTGNIHCYRSNILAAILKIDIGQARKLKAGGEVSVDDDAARRLANDDLAIIVPDKPRKVTGRDGKPEKSINESEDSHE